MLADNGIYILQTDGQEFRVVHTQGIENYMLGEKGKINWIDPDIHIRNARRIWKGCIVFKSREDALAEAERMYQEVMESAVPVVVDGIAFITIERRF